MSEEDMLGCGKSVSCIPEVKCGASLTCTSALGRCFNVRRAKDGVHQKNEVRSVQARGVARCESKIEAICSE
jgi:hypothetical protein